MSWVLTYQAQVQWVGDGIGQLNMPIGPNFEFANSGTGILVAGVANPTSAQFTTALTAAAADLTTQLTTQPKFAQIQSVSSGGPYF